MVLSNYQRKGDEFVKLQCQADRVRVQYAYSLLEAARKFWKVKGLQEWNNRRVGKSGHCEYGVFEGPDSVRSRVFRQWSRSDMSTDIRHIKSLHCE